jgi:hypothetical protein
MSVDIYGKRADGTPIMLGYEHPRNLNMNNVNARVVMELLELPCDEGCYGEADIHTVRRAIMKAKALFHRRVVHPSISKAYVQHKLTKLSETVETLGGMGATVIYWA